MLTDSSKILSVFEDDDEEEVDDEEDNEEDDDHIMMVGCGSHGKLKGAVGLLKGGVLAVFAHFRLLLVPHNYHLRSKKT